MADSGSETDTSFFWVERCRKVTPELVEAWARLMPQLNPAHPPPAQADLEAILAGDATELYIARLGDEVGEIAGALALVIFHTPTGTHAWIEDVVVDASCRGQGIGTALTRAALERARERGAKAVDLTSRPARAEANRLYISLGFEPRATNVYRYIFKSSG